MLCEMQQMASSLARMQVHEPKVFIDPDYLWLGIKNECLHLDSFHAGLQSIVSEIKNLYVSFSGDAAWPAVPDHLMSDDMENTSRGYCFLEESLFKEERHSFFFSAVERHELGGFSSDGNWVWNNFKISDFLHRADSIWGHVIHALYIGTHLSLRATEVLLYQIQNDDWLQNLLFQGKKIIFFCRYSKTTSSRGADGCIPAFLPEPLQDIVLVLLGGGFKEVQALLAGIKYGEHARYLYHT